MEKMECLLDSALDSMIEISGKLILFIACSQYLSMSGHIEPIDKSIEKVARFKNLLNEVLFELSTAE